MFHLYVLLFILNGRPNFLFIYIFLYAKKTTNHIRPRLTQMIKDSPTRLFNWVESFFVFGYMIKFLI